MHGANRLASNSLLEGLVFGDRVVRHLDRYIGRLGEDVRRLQFELPAPSGPAPQRSDIAAVRRAVTGLMSEKVGWLRTEDGLVSALERLRATNSALRLGEAGPPEFELLNILTLATQITKCALLREETRGVHVRDDHPERDDYHWQRHITLRLPGSPTDRGAPVTAGLSDQALRAAARAAARRALAEDLAGFGDLAGAPSPRPDGRGSRRAPTASCRVSRRSWRPPRLVDPDLRVAFALDAGARFRAGDTLATLAGRQSSILALERTGLNFLARLSGVATLTARYVAETAGTTARDRRHAQDHSRAARPREAGHRRRRRQRRIASDSSTAPWSRTTTWPPPAASPRPWPPCAPACRMPISSRSRSTRRGSSTKRSPPACR